MITFIYSKTSTSEHLYIVNNSLFWTLSGPTKPILLEMHLSIVNTSWFWTWTPFFSPFNYYNLSNVNRYSYFFFFLLICYTYILYVWPIFSDYNVCSE